MKTAMHKTLQDANSLCSENNITHHCERADFNFPVLVLNVYII